MSISPLILMLQELAGASVAEEKVNVAEALRHLPVDQRALLAAVALAAADFPVNNVTVARAAGYSRGTAYRNNKEALDLVVENASLLADGLLDRAGDHQSIQVLSAKLQESNLALQRLRERVNKAERERDIAVSYARDLHQQLAPEYKAIVAEKGQKVRHLRPLQSADEPSEDV
jgi:hypothetical protein